MSRFKTHTLESAPEAGRDTLKTVKDAYGFIPNLIANMVESPAAAKAYVTLGGIFEETSFSPTEQQVVLLTISRLNDCEYCVSAHSAIAGMQDVDAAVVDAIRDDKPIDDKKLEALRQLVTALHEKRGWLDDGDIDAFVEAGYGPQQVLEAVLGVTFKTLSNYTNHITGTKLDKAFSDTAWKAPAKAVA